jgi:hypothetical protein
MRFALRARLAADAHWACYFAAGLKEKMERLNAAAAEKK